MLMSYKVRYLLNMCSYGSLCVKVKRLDPLDVLLFLLTLKIDLPTDLDLHSSRGLLQGLCTQIFTLPAPYLNCTSQQQQQKLLYFLQTLFCGE